MIKLYQRLLSVNNKEMRTIDDSVKEVIGLLNLSELENITNKIEQHYKMK